MISWLFNLLTGYPILSLNIMADMRIDLLSLTYSLGMLVVSAPFLFGPSPVRPLTRSAL